MSWPADPASGPSWPQPVTRPYTRRGLRARQASGPIPSRSATPGRNPSTRASAAATRSSTTPGPSGCLRSTATRRRPRANSAGQAGRAGAGRSTASTSAPRPARSMAQNGPGPIPASSTIRTPWSGPMADIVGPAAGDGRRAMGDVRFDGRVAIVTGAGGGLGREHALLLASRGAKVVVNDFGGGDVVISNAGILRDKAFHNLTPELLDPVLDVHLKGAFHVLRPAWVKMREAGYGRVLVTASNAGILGNFGQSNYGAAKMGLVGLARVLAQEGPRHNIKANVLAPIARTRMTEELLAPKLDPGLVAPVAAWLVSEECPVTGEIYSAGGGRVARFFIGLTEGYANPALTLEDVRDQFDQIRDEAGYSVPTGVADELSGLLERLR